MCCFRLYSGILLLVMTPVLFCQAPKAFTLSGDYALTHDPSIRSGYRQTIRLRSKIYPLAARAIPALPEPPKPNLPAEWQAIEAPFIVHHEDYYYLFVSFDLCCRGTKSNYRTMVGRSHQVTGPYVDADGKPMLKGGGTQILWPNNRLLGPGGESILTRPEGDVIIFHAYDATTGKPALQISTLTWQDGWPHAALETTGESK